MNNFLNEFYHTDKDGVYSFKTRADGRPSKVYLIFYRPGMQSQLAADKRHLKALSHSRLDKMLQ